MAGHTKEPCVCGKTYKQSVSDGLVEVLEATSLGWKISCRGCGRSSSDQYNLDDGNSVEQAWEDWNHMIRSMKACAGIENPAEALDKAREGLKGAIAAADELMTEFVSHGRAAQWGTINDGLVAANKALTALNGRR